MEKKLLIIKGGTLQDSESLARFFKRKNWNVGFAENLVHVKKHLIDYDFCPDVILADLDVTKDDIYKASEELQALSDYPEWIFVYDPDKDIEIEEVDDLAYDLLAKPIDQHRIEVVAKRAQRLAYINRRLRKSSANKKQRYQVESYLGRSDAAQQVRGMLSALADAPISAVTITGETGTGKGLAAKIIHHCGLRSDGPLVEINCAALPKELLESQLFGHEAGAFTGAKERYRGLFEQANGGTLFLDEIGDMDLDLQSKLLKAIEDKKARRLGGEREIQFDIQVIAATGVNLEAAVGEGEFRADLYHRLNVFCIHLPILAERKEDLVELVPNIINEFNYKANKHVTTVTDNVWEQLFNYPWPGNIRELRNVIERSVLLAQDEILPSKWLQLNEVSEDLLNGNTETHAPINSIAIPLDGSMKLDEMDSFIIQTVLERNDYNVSQTADVLGSTRETLRYRIQKYGLKDKA